MRLKFEGGRELERALMDLKTATAKSVVRKVLKGAAQPIADAGRGNAPQRLGDLRASYGVGTRLTKRQRRKSRKESEVEVYAGPGEKGAAQGVQTEFGNEHQAAEPHLRPAWDAHKDGALRHIETEMGGEIAKAAARAARRAAKKAGRG